MTAMELFSSIAERAALVAYRYATVAEQLEWYKSMDI